MKSTGRRETTYARACASLFYLSVPLCIRPLSCGWYAPPKFSSCAQGNSSHFSLFLIYRVYRRSRRLLRVISFDREAEDTIFSRNETMQRETRRRLILWRFRLKNELFFYYKSFSPPLFYQGSERLSLRPAITASAWHRAC